MQISNCRGHRFVSPMATPLLLASCAAPELAGTSPSAPVSSAIATSIPPKQSSKPALGRALTIVVKPGQSLGRIAEHYHVPKRTIIAANQLQPPYELKAGSQLVIPGAATNTATAEPHQKTTTQGSAEMVHATKARAPSASELETIPHD
jgi:LysM repeat protein